MTIIFYKFDVYKEYVLPGTDNINYNLNVDREIFGLSGEIEIRFDVKNYVWTVYSGENYSIKFGTEYVDSHILKNGEVIQFKTSSDERFTAIICESSNELRPLNKYDLSRTENLTVGEGSENTVFYKFGDFVSKHHCEIRRRGNSFYIRDYSKNGVFISNRRISDNYRLEYGDTLNIFGLYIVFLGNSIFIGSRYGEMAIKNECFGEFKNPEIASRDTTYENKRKNANFNRSPRNIPTIHTDVIDIAEPPAPRFSKKKPALYTVGPAFTMAIPMMLGSFVAIISSRMSSTGGTRSAFMFTGIITAIGSAIIGVIWALLNIRYTKQSEAHDEQERFNAYSNYIVELVGKIKEYYESNFNALHSMYPSSKDCCSYNANSSELWSRNLTHRDFLFYRVGIGNIPFQVTLNIPKEKFSLEYDSLKEKPTLIKTEYEILRDVPVGVDLSKISLYGIADGGDINRGMEVVYNLVSQIAANNCYTDVKLVFIYDERKSGNNKRWEFARWLPHVWSEDKKTRYIAGNKLEVNDILYDLTNILRSRSETSGAIQGKPVIKPYYILFVEDICLLEDELILKYIYDEEKDYGLRTFILTDVYTHLPNACENIIRCDRVFSGIYNIADMSDSKQLVRFDSIGLKDVVFLAKNISDIKVSEPESTSNVISRLDFFEMYGISRLEDFNVEERWRKNRTFNTMRALIGKKAGGGDCYLDIHEKFHGPHGLVAGTTGSGKSELLQTYILSLAINFNPEDVAFFVIDYKGGGMANLFSNLPHMIGHISNLSGNQVRRAMISIKSENLRRQRLFNEYGVNNINLYTRLYKNNETSIPVPHLFIIIDEFAELKKEESDFMKDLISVAQVGRSLGVHLILSTQKPAGTVDDNIWSNSKFRLCLRVQDKQDSNDMLHKPDAAYITQAGRAYLQVGNDELYEFFQSGWSGATYVEDLAYRKSESSTMILNTGKTALAGNRAQIKRKEKERHDWYALILKCIVMVMKENGFTAFSQVKALDSVKLSAFIAQLISKINVTEQDFSDTTTNRMGLETFISFLPEDKTATEEIVDTIMQLSSKTGRKMPEKREKTQLEAIVKYLAKVAEKEGYNYNLQLWLPVLPEYLYLRELNLFNEFSFDGNRWPKDNGKWSLEAVVGLYDDPKNQSQLPVTVNLAENGHCAVIGMVVSGKSTWLQTFIYSLANRYSPDHVNFYMLDFSSQMLAPFDSLPHCGGVIFDGDPDKISKFFHMLNAEMDSRKKLLGGGNYIQYVQAYGKRIPAWVIVIDGYAAFKEKTNGAYDDAIMRLSKEGIGYGIYMAVSASGFGINELPNRIADNIRSVFSLEMGDKFKYMDVMRTTRLETLPETGVKGRGLVNIDGNILEYHTALAIEAEDDFSRIRQLGLESEKMKSAWAGQCARGIPVIPVNATYDDLAGSQDYQIAIQKDTRFLPFAYKIEDASVYSVDLSKTYCYAISGKNRSGKTTALKLLINSAHKKGGRIVIFEKGISELKKTAQVCCAEYISSDKELFGFFTGLKDIFVSRNRKKRELISEGLSESEIYDIMSKEEPIYFFVSDIASFVECIYNPEPGVGAMKGFAENITEKGSLHNIYLFACVNTDSSVMASTYQLYKNFTFYKTGVHLGGNVNAQRIFNFQNIPFSEQSKPMKKGIGLVPSEEDDSVCNKIVIPTI